MFLRGVVDLDGFSPVYLKPTLPFRFLGADKTRRKLPEGKLDKGTPSSDE
jgi:hypothetical protein